ncbi:cobalt-precorrin-6A reductase [Rhodovulum sp. DZ06]|uniref:cobalt-precorrin-6A reductase n=1 Tax=Rhodovulum sp. DZ06 TaxID=3425126 RepID=UPI003D3379A3
MRNPLVLGGATEGAALAKAMAEAGIPGTVSLAGRVARPRPLPLPTRVGGFGGAAGLADYIRLHGVTHVIDATHPFAARMSRNAAEACAATGAPLLALTRAPWAAVAGDDWRAVPDIAGAVEALAGMPPATVFLGTGRNDLEAFRPVAARHRLILRVVDDPGAAPLPGAEVIVARGPFDADADREMLEARGVGVVVSKNSGGTGAYAKIAAARALGLPVVMVDRPPSPERAEVHDIGEVLRWLAHAGMERGV